MVAPVTNSHLNIRLEVQFVRGEEHTIDVDQVTKRKEVYRSRKRMAHYKRREITPPKIRFIALLQYY